MRSQVSLAATLLLGILQSQHPSAVTLELRVFNAAEEVTSHVRATIHRGGDRGEPVAHRNPAESPLELNVPEGIYDVQVFLERDGKVLNIRWANRLVVMRYPDEGGRHLEVVNFQSGFGALQVRGDEGPLPDVSIYPAGRRDRVAAQPVAGPDYLLFVVQSGVYDLQTRVSGKTAWHSAVEVPLDRTRFWVIPRQD
jgi:hypothetical protein